MKTYKILFASLCLAALASTSLFAQVDVTVSANAIATLTLTKVSDINLGNIQALLQSTLDPNAGTANVNIGNSFALGELTITGETGQDVSVTYDDATLSNGSDPDETFTTTAYSGGSLISGDLLTLTGGTATLYLGGSTDASGLPAGTWTTDADPVTVSVNYN